MQFNYLMQTAERIVSTFADFCTVDDETCPFFLRVQDQALESYTMREVFSMDSSVRIEAIENLGTLSNSNKMSSPKTIVEKTQERQQIWLDHLL